MFTSAGSSISRRRTLPSGSGRFRKSERPFDGLRVTDGDGGEGRGQQTEVRRQEFIYRLCHPEPVEGSSESMMSMRPNSKQPFNRLSVTPVRLTNRAPGVILID